MRLLDLFCGAGGAAMGYHRAGFEVVGVDINPQPHYPFEFHQADALTFPLDGYDAIHASPPCQAYSSATPADRVHPDLYAPTRDRLTGLGVPYVIENVIGAPYSHGFVLCGSMFDMKVQRHRNFETSWMQLMPLYCDHSGDRPITVSGNRGVPDARGVVDYKHSRQSPMSWWPELMGMPWAAPLETKEAIPPVYTEWIGRQLMTVLERAA